MCEAWYRLGVRFCGTADDAHDLVQDEPRGARTGDEPPPRRTLSSIHLAAHQERVQRGRPRMERRIFRAGDETVRQDVRMEDDQPRAMTSEPDPRVFFAAERTFLAWIRTGLALMGFGFVVARFGLFLREVAAMQGGPPAPGGVSRWFGIGLIGLGVVVTAASAAAHVSTVRRLNRGEPFVGRPTWLGVAIAVLLVAIGVSVSIYLIAAP